MQGRALIRRSALHISRRLPHQILTSDLDQSYFLFLDDVYAEVRKRIEGIVVGDDLISDHAYV